MPLPLQKNKGPLLTSLFKGLVEHIPPEWRARLGLKRFAQENPTDIDEDPITGFKINSEVNQTRTDERKKTDIELLTDPTNVTLNQQKRLVNGQLVTEVRTFVPEGTPLAGVGVETIEAEQKNLGIGWMTNDVTDADLPGPTVESNRIDKDGVVIQTFKTRRLRTEITEGETIVAGVWTKTSVEGETDLVATEVVEQRTLPGNAMHSSRVDEDSASVLIVTTFKDKTTVTSGETLVGGIWTKTEAKSCTSEMGVTDLVVDEVVEGRAIPGNDVESTRLDDDGRVVHIHTTLRNETLIVSGETLIAGIWRKVTKKSVSDLVAQEIVETRVIPGNPIPSTKLDKDSIEIEVVRTMKESTAIVTNEVTSGGLWIKTTSEQIGDLVSWEIVEARAIPGNSVGSASIDGDQEVQNISVLLREESAITPSSDEAGGFITAVEKKAVTDKVAEQVTTVTRWLDKALYSQRLPENIIPLEFRAQVPTVTVSNIVPGIAAMPTLVDSQIFAQEHQLTKNLKEVRTDSFGLDLEFPVVTTGYETTEEFGGGVLAVVRTLHNAVLLIDTGEAVTRSKITVIGDELFWFRESAFRFDGVEWPELVGTEVDPRTGIVVEVRRQVVTAPATGGVSVDGYTDIKPIDKWRSLQIVSKLDLDSVPSARTWETTVEHSFPHTLNSATFMWASATGVLSYAFDSALLLDITEGYAGPCRALVTESFSDGPPVDVVAITQFFPQGYTIGYAWSLAASLTTECDTCTDYTTAHAQTWPVPPTLHDEIDVGGAITIVGGEITGTLPATDPIALPASGMLITKAVDVEPWRFNIFYRRMVQIYVP